MALVDKPVAELRANAEQHLELVLVVIETGLLDESLRLRDEPLVVRRDPDIAACVDQRLERAHVVRADGSEVAVRDLRRLDVDPLAETHARTKVRKLVDV